MKSKSGKTSVDFVLFGFLEYTNTAAANNKFLDDLNNIGKNQYLLSSVWLIVLAIR